MRCWDEVTTCSKSCNRKRKSNDRALVHDDVPHTDQVNNETVLQYYLYLSRQGQDRSARPIDEPCDSNSQCGASQDETTRDDARATRKTAMKRTKAERRVILEGPIRSELRSEKLRWLPDECGLTSFDVR